MKAALSLPRPWAAQLLSCMAQPRARLRKWHSMYTACIPREERSQDPQLTQHLPRADTRVWGHEHLIPALQSIHATEAVLASSCSHADTLGGSAGTESTAVEVPVSAREYQSYSPERQEWGQHTCVRACSQLESRGTGCTRIICLCLHVLFKCKTRKTGTERASENYDGSVMLGRQLYPLPTAKNQLRFQPALRRQRKIT